MKKGTEKFMSNIQFNRKEQFPTKCDTPAYLLRRDDVTIISYSYNLSCFAISLSLDSSIKSFQTSQSINNLSLQTRILLPRVGLVL